MTYIYVKKDLTFIEDPASQTLLKAFLKAVYSDEYITQCEEEFGFVRIGGELRDQALKSIDEIITTDGAPEWSFETDTEKNVGQADYVISKKRQSYSEIEQDKLVEQMNKMSLRIDELQAENKSMKGTLASDPTATAAAPVKTATKETSTNSFESFVNEDEDEQVKIALIMSSVSIALWIVATLVMVVNYMSASGSKAAATTNATKPEEMMEAGVN